MSPWTTLLFVETLTANIVAATNGVVPSPTLVKKIPDNFKQVHNKGGQTDVNVGLRSDSWTVHSV